MVSRKEPKNNKDEFSATSIDIVFLLCLVLVSSCKMLIAANFRTSYGLEYQGTVDIFVETAKILKYSNSFPIGGTTTFFLMPYTLTLLLRLGITGKAPLYLGVFSNLACGLVVYLLTSEMYTKKTGFISG